MSYAKALTPLEEQRREASMRWQRAQQEYSSECAWFYRLRKTLPPKGMMSNEQFNLYTLAKTRMSEASKKRAQEENIFNSMMNPYLSPDIQQAQAMAMAKEIQERILGTKPSLVQEEKEKQERQRIKEIEELREAASPKYREEQEAIRRAGLARMEGKRLDPWGNVISEEDESLSNPVVLIRQEGYRDPTAPPGAYEPYIPPVTPEIETDPFGEPIDDSLMDTDPDPVSDAVSIAPEAPEPLKTQELEQPEQTEPESHRERVLSNPLWASIAQAASEFIPPPKASPLEQEGNGMPKTYDEYVKERELAQANTPPFNTPNPKG